MEEGDEPKVKVSIKYGDKIESISSLYEFSSQVRTGKGYVYFMF